MANNIDNKDNYKPDINCNQLQLDVPKCDANKVCRQYRTFNKNH